MLKSKYLVLSLILSFIIVAIGSFSVGAATVNYGKTTFTEENGGEDYKITVNYTVSSYEQGEQVTMLVLTGTDTIQFDTVETDKPINIAYIDQQPITSESNSFTFLLDRDFVRNNKLFVKLGSSSMLQPVDKTYTFVSGNETGQVNVSEVTNAFGLSGKTLLIVTTENTLPYEAVVKIGGQQMYKVANDGVVNKYIAVVDNYDSTNPEFITANGENQELIIGDSNGDSAINSSDISNIINKIISGSAFTEIVNMCSDFNGDGMVNITDITYLYDYINGNITDIPALNR